jgi:hypothetical protein
MDLLVPIHSFKLKYDSLSSFGYFYHLVNVIGLFQTQINPIKRLTFWGSNKLYRKNRGICTVGFHRKTVGLVGIIFWRPAQDKFW